MATIRSLAADLNAQEHEIRAFAGPMMDELPDGVTDVDELPEEWVADLLDAWHSADAS